MAMKLEPGNAAEASRLYGRHFDFHVRLEVLFALCYACNFVRPSVCNDDTEKQVGHAPSRRRTPGLHTLCSSALTGD